MRKRARNVGAAGWGVWELTEGETNGCFIVGAEGWLPSRWSFIRHMITAPTLIQLGGIKKCLTNTVGMDPRMVGGEPNVMGVERSFNLE